jgi:hypothetical protein
MRASWALQLTGSTTDRIRGISTKHGRSYDLTSLKKRIFTLRPNGKLLYVANEPRGGKENGENPHYCEEC